VLSIQISWKLLSRDSRMRGCERPVRYDEFEMKETTPCSAFSPIRFSANWKNRI